MYCLKVIFTGLLCISSTISQHRAPPGVNPNQYQQGQANPGQYQHQQQYQGGAPGVPPQQYQQAPQQVNQQHPPANQQYQQPPPQQQYQAQPNAGHQQPNAGHQQPNAGQQQPNAGHQQPNAGHQQPNAGQQQPNAGQQQPNAGHQHQQQQRVLHNNNLAQERDHIKDHLEVPLDTSGMSEEELQFHYFKMHDADNNNKLDGQELIKSLFHWHDSNNHDPAKGDQPAPPGPKIFTDDELVNMIDPILDQDDKNSDGFIDYPEFVQAQRAAAASAAATNTAA